MTNQPPKTQRTCLAIVLAAGEGTRMKSSLPKVMHKVGGRSMLGHVLDAVAQAGATALAVVVGPDREDVAKEARAHAPDATVYVQRERLGTAHAVLAAREALEKGYDDVIVAFADTPLIRPETFAALRASLAKGASIVGLGFEAKDPAGYGRFVMDGEMLEAIVEHKDATASQRTITLCNAGLMALDGRRAIALLSAVGNDNAQKEYYLPDAAIVARAQGLSAGICLAPEDEVMGVNDRIQLSVAESVFQGRMRHAAMAGGTTLIAPETVFFSHDTKIGRDVIVEQHVVFGVGVAIADGAVVHAFCHFEGATIGPKANVGPYARLRPGADLGENAKVGNFVEIKGATIGKGAKVSHLSYIGDADVGAEANIGAGTITCNYDGFFKYHTSIGDNAFVGTNTSLVAPVRIGAGAFIASGSVITDDVPVDALALGRGRQVVKDGWAAQFRAESAQRKAALKKS
jgi:bifunctional UDP-N-acetylglucosamine pyrophosphorylase / glucosamine-1-phosphate N-acetyltransferase